MLELSKEQAIHCLQEGKVILLQTDTILGLSACLSKDSAKHINHIKKAPLDKPLIQLITSQKELDQWAEPLRPDQDAAIQKHWPGPTTLLFNKKKETPPYVTGESDKIAYRLPAHEALISLLKDIGQTVLSTSANITGKSPAKNKEDLDPDLIEKVAGIYTFDAHFQGAPSAIWDISTPNHRQIR